MMVHGSMRQEIQAEILGIEPCDQKEIDDKAATLAWLTSGAEIFRREKPATPPPHLVAYFAVVDGDHLLLVDHINAELWLPNGGHVDAGEHPRETVVREAMEELSIQADFLFAEPLFLTLTETVGKTAGHTDVAIWYALRGDRRTSPAFDGSEFRSVRWFHKDEIPLDRTDPDLGRFLTKLHDRRSVRPRDPKAGKD